MMTLKQYDKLREAVQLTGLYPKQVDAIGEVELYQVPQLLTALRSIVELDYEHDVIASDDHQVWIEALS